MKKIFEKINKNKWYWREISKNFKKSFLSVSLYILFLALLAAWKFLIGQDFVWQSISPMPEPNIFIRILYSAITFISLGAILYSLGFYKALHNVCVKILGDWQLYKGIKKIVWIFLMALMFFYIVPFIVFILNSIISFFFNILIFILYLFPPFGFAVLIYFTSLMIYNKDVMKIEKWIRKIYKKYITLKSSTSEEL